MNKRSAMLVAAGLVLTLMVGGIAVAVGMTGPEASSAQPRLTVHKKQKPIVKTTHETVTVHRKAKGSGASVVTLPAASSGSSETTSSGSGSSAYGDGSSSDDTTYSDDGSGDDHEESEDPGGSDDEPSDDGGSGDETDD